MTSEVIVAEVVYVYSSRSTYKQSLAQVVAKFKPLLELEMSYNRKLGWVAGVNRLEP